MAHSMPYNQRYFFKLYMGRAKFWEENAHPALALRDRLEAAKVGACQHAIMEQASQVCTSLACHARSLQHCSKLLHNKPAAQSPILCSAFC